MARTPKKARGFKPAKKSSRRTTDAPKPKREAPEAVGELEILESEEEKRGMQIESAIVLMTALGLVLGLIWCLAAYGKHYNAGPFKAMYEKPDETHFMDPGVGAFRLRVLPAPPENS